MSKISNLAIRLLQESVVARGTSEVMEAMYQNKHFFHSVVDTYNINNSLSTTQLLDAINDYYDFNEFGGLTEDSTQEMIETLMPRYVQSIFEIDVQDGILDESVKLLTLFIEGDEE